MKLKNLLISGALAASAVSTVPAYAVATPGVIPVGAQANDFYSAYGAFNGWTTTNGPGIAGYFGSDIWFSGGTITVDFFGREAGFTNSFSLGTFSLTLGGGNSFPNAGGVPTPTASVPPVISSGSAGAFGAGLLPFSFSTVNFSNVMQTVTNGANPGNTSGAPNFFASIGPDSFATTSVLGQSAIWLFLDDGGGGDDDNHDDFIVRLRSDGTFRIPEPFTLGILGAGLLGMGLARRKRA